MAYRENDRPKLEIPPDFRAASTSTFDDTLRDLLRDWHAAQERACEEALAAAGGDMSRCSREPHADNVVTIRVDGKPFRRVEIAMPTAADDYVIRIVTTDLTKEQP